MSHVLTDEQVEQLLHMLEDIDKGMSVDYDEDAFEFARDIEQVWYDGNACGKQQVLRKLYKILNEEV